MPVKRCSFGFNCGSMMMQPGLMAEDCPNHQTCGLLTDLTPDEEVELIRVREVEFRESQERARQEREAFRVTQRQAAILMLQMRGCSQSVESLGLIAVLNQAESLLGEVRSQLGTFEVGYVAPVECEAHRYNVKRPRGVYWYNKLTAGAAIFEPSERDRKVRVIHLSHDDDARNQEARAGIERRNKLLRAKTQLNLVVGQLFDVLSLLSDES